MSIKHKIAAIAMVSLPLGACATIIDGTSQEITVNTNPISAHCGL